MLNLLATTDFYQIDFVIHRGVNRGMLARHFVSLDPGLNRMDRRRFPCRLQPAPARLQHGVGGRPADWSAPIGPIINEGLEVTWHVRLINQQSEHILFVACSHRMTTS